MKTPDSTIAVAFLTLMALFHTAAAVAQPQSPEDITAEDVRAQLDHLEKPMYTPFIEMYLLEETKALRKAVLISEAYRDDASVDPSFYGLREHESFRKLVNQEDEDAPDS